MRAAIYSRFSTDRQSESSIEDQVRICEEYARQEAMTVCERFADHGISGASIGNRPGYMKLRESLLGRRFDVVLVSDLSRLSRSTGDLNKEIDRFVARGIRVVGVQDGYDSARKGHKLQAGLSGIIGEAFRDMVKDRTHAALESRARFARPTGGKCYGYRNGTVVESEAAIVREIFERFAGGASCRAIAADLNARGVPSPGSTWTRTERRCAGWIGSCVRAILRNERYTGTVSWNTSEWVKDPDTGKRRRRARPHKEWITHHLEELRIVSDDLYRRAQRRTRLGNDERLRSGGKPRYLLSGLLTCAECGAHYVIAGPDSYACSSYVNGRACANAVRVPRSQLEKVLLGPVRERLLDPDRVKRIAREMHRLLADRVRAESDSARAAPIELRELDARIERLQARRTSGDPDLTDDELAAAIERVQAKRKDLLSARPAAVQARNIVNAVPQVAELYRQQIEMGLDGNPSEATNARMILREIFGGKVALQRDGRQLWAHIKLRPEALLLRAEGTCGSGGRI